MDRCEGCGFEYDLAAAPGTGAAIVEGAAELSVALAAAPDPRLRPQPAIW